MIEAIVSFWETVLQICHLQWEKVRPLRISSGLPMTMMMERNLKDKRNEIRTKSKLRGNLINIRKIMPSPRKKRSMTLTW
jgi:hypothetical protein